MYRLYIIVGNNSKYCPCFDKKDLMETMVEIANKYHIYNFDIWETLDNQSYHYKRIMGVEEFEQALAEYKEPKTIPDLSCLELKDFITKRALKRKR